MAEENNIPTSTPVSNNKTIPDLLLYAGYNTNQTNEDKVKENDNLNKPDKDIKDTIKSNNGEPIKDKVIPSIKKNDVTVENTNQSEQKSENNQQQDVHDYQKRFNDIFPRFTNLRREYSEIKKHIPQLVRDKLTELLNGNYTTNDDLINSLVGDIDNAFNKNNINFSEQSNDNSENSEISNFLNKFGKDLEHYGEYNREYNNIFEQSQNAYNMFCNMNNQDKIDALNNDLIELYNKNKLDAIEYMKDLITYMEPVTQAGGSLEFRLQQEEIINKLTKELQDSNKEIEKYKEKIKEYKNNLDITYKKAENINNSGNYFDNNEKQSALLRMVTSSSK